MLLSLTITDVLNLFPTKFRRWVTVAHAYAREVNNTLIHYPKHRLMAKLLGTYDGWVCHPFSYTQFIGPDPTQILSRDHPCTRFMGKQFLESLSYALLGRPRNSCVIC